MLNILVSSLVLAAPPGLSLEGHSDDCDLYIGRATPDGAVPMYADCRWTELSLSALDQALWQAERADEVFDRVEDALLVSQRSNTKSVWQLHSMSGLSDREVYVAWTRVVTGAEVRFDWKSAPYPLQRADAVACKRWDGSWTLNPLPGGGTHVEYYALYNAGEIPSTLVEWFGVSGLRSMVGDLREAVKAARLGR